MPVGIEQSKQTSAAGQIMEQMTIVSLQPTVKGTSPNPFEGKQNGNRDHFAGKETGLGVLLRIWASTLQNK
ncbi:MAG: hypothetical protein A2Z16_16235 [Chloroflexi bacterium RBG_16_54_18]|nr:MAG: hypothetical protein A2Z16_16235 [Chloroflexi bacterium RBG_16_54_18]